MRGVMFVLMMTTLGCGNATFDAASGVGRAPPKPAAAPAPGDPGNGMAGSNPHAAPSSNAVPTSSAGPQTPPSGVATRSILVPATPAAPAPSPNAPVPALAPPPPGSGQACSHPNAIPAGSAAAYADGSGVLTLTGTAGSDHYRLTATAAADAVVFDDGRSAAPLAVYCVKRVVVNLLAGADTLTLDNSGGQFFAPTGGVDLDGGTGSASLSLLGTTMLDADTDTATGPGAGRVELRKGAATVLITYRNLAP